MKKKIIIVICILIIFIGCNKESELDICIKDCKKEGYKSGYIDMGVTDFNNNIIREPLGCVCIENEPL